MTKTYIYMCVCVYIYIYIHTYIFHYCMHYILNICISLLYSWYILYICTSLLYALYILYMCIIYIIYMYFIYICSGQFYLYQSLYIYICISLSHSNEISTNYLAYIYWEYNLCQQNCMTLSLIHMNILLEIIILMIIMIHSNKSMSLQI